MKTEDLIAEILEEESTGTVANCPAWVMPCGADRLRLLFILGYAGFRRAPGLRPGLAPRRAHNLEAGVSVWTIEREYTDIGPEEYPAKRIFDVSLADPKSIEKLKKIKKEGKNADLT